MAMDNLLVIRQACGGAGYLAWSSLPYLIDDMSATVTYEGDNTVMAQQSARFLQKLYKRAKKGKNLPSLYNYISDIDKNSTLKCTATAAADFTTPKMVEEALRAISSIQITTTMQKISAATGGKLTIANNHALDVVQMTQTHIRYITYLLMV